MFHCFNALPSATTHQTSFIACNDIVHLDLSSSVSHKLALQLTVFRITTMHCLTAGHQIHFTSHFLLCMTGSLPFWVSKRSIGEVSCKKCTKCIHGGKRSSQDSRQWQAYGSSDTSPLLNDSTHSFIRWCQIAFTIWSYHFCQFLYNVQLLLIDSLMFILLFDAECAIIFVVFWQLNCLHVNVFNLTKPRTLVSLPIDLYTVDDHEVLGSLTSLHTGAKKGALSNNNKKTWDWEDCLVSAAGESIRLRRHYSVLIWSG